MSYETGWLAPDGTFFQCDVMDHIAVADELVEKFGYHDINCRNDDILMNHGWVHISISFFCHEFRIYWDKHLTELQKSFLKPYFEQDYMPIPAITKDEWEDENKF